MPGFAPPTKKPGSKAGDRNPFRSPGQGREGSSPWAEFRVAALGAVPAHLRPRPESLAGEPIGLGKDRPGRGESVGEVGARAARVEPIGSCGARSRRRRGPHSGARACPGPGGVRSAGCSRPDPAPVRRVSGRCGPGRAGSGEGAPAPRHRRRVGHARRRRGRGLGGQRRRAAPLRRAPFFRGAARTRLIARARAR